MASSLEGWVWGQRFCIGRRGGGVRRGVKRALRLREVTGVGWGEGVFRPEREEKCDQMCI